MEVVEIDDQGRFCLPPNIRSKLSYTKFRVVLEGDRVVLIPVKPNIEKYYGIARSKYGLEVDEAVRHETEKILKKEITE